MVISFLFLRKAFSWLLIHGELNSRFVLRRKRIELTDNNCVTVQWVLKKFRASLLCELELSDRMDAYLQIYQFGLDRGILGRIIAGEGEADI